METMYCSRCREDRAALEKPPFKGERGERIRAHVCAACWKDWLQHQTLLINHYGLDPRDPKAREFLYRQVDETLLGDGDAEQVDTSERDQIKW